MIKFLRRQQWLTLPYHFLMGFLGALWYGFPSRKLYVIGVTGTKGKTTTSNLIWHLLTKAGHKTGMATTVNFRIGEMERVNESKQTMLGRFALQKLLREMVNAGCTHAVVETSSWGIVQYRHRFINYAVAVITNLTPEHIEQHGGFDKYRDAKIKLFAHTAYHKNAVGERDGAGVYNLDDESADAFIKVPMPRTFGYTLKGERKDAIQATVAIENILLASSQSVFSVNGVQATLPLPGQFNVYNAAAAVAAVWAAGVVPNVSVPFLSSAPQVKGRIEVVQQPGKPTIIIDYAHEPASLEAVYRAGAIYKPRRVICVLGSQGGGRDVWKREAMGRVAANYVDTIILTNEDPYDEDPARIIDDIERGVMKEMSERKDTLGKKDLQVEKIVDRAEAIERAITGAAPEDVILITGKGGEVWMCVADGKKIPWDDKKIVMEALAKRV
jgi:UDP-N-acetylmuramoyl-L-alanyl-D-glutamate--2,6-diaminopimelate ligase